jgi:hypothetical protein
MTPYPTDADFAGHAEEALAERLRQIAVEADPVPDLVLESARAALSLRRLDSELAEIMHDSDIDGIGAVRGPADDGDGDVRLLSFEAPGVSITAQLSTAEDERWLIGQVAGAEVVAVSLQTPSGGHAAELGDGGTFRLDTVPTGPVRLLVRTTAGEVVGDWVTV